ncbi:ABC transporter permease [Ruania zhangjianzhongii]|uniref:ABC transporter permease n=1 Tax=Ruania zhangjianzhongii TaxID=2603206 RepID=UPI0011C6FE0D|nr:ABC transporter permease subunit [Ruania zhangjianzhongii]
MSAWTRGLLAVVGVVVALGAWWLLTADSTDPYVPPMVEVLRHAWEYWAGGEGRPHLLSSMANLGVGLAVAILAGLVLGLVIGQQRWLDRALSPTGEFVRAIPATALVPLAMVLFGLGTTMKVVIIALGCFFPVLLNVIDGCRGISPTLHDTARSFGIRGPIRQFSVVLPAVYPRAAAGIRTAIPLALILVVTSEMTGSAVGVGFVLTTAQSSFDLTAVWSAIVLLGVLGVLLNLLFDLVERLIDRRYYQR